MKLIELIAPVTAPAGLNDLEITGLTADSREVQPGFLFAALPGTRQDGRSFAADAVARGARAILTDDRDALGLQLEQRARVSVIIDAPRAGG